MTDQRRSDGGTDDGDGGAPSSNLSTETAFELLADRRRRLVLEYLSAADDETVDLDGLADRLARREEGNRRSIAAALHHVHLPKLADADVVDYDARSGDVRYQGDPFVEATLEVASDSGLLMP